MGEIGEKPPETALNRRNRTETASMEAGSASFPHNIFTGKDAIEFDPCKSADREAPDDHIEVLSCETGLLSDGAH